MKIIHYLLHVIQIGVLFGIYELHDLYYNHLGFMRNVSFYQAELEKNAAVKLILPIAILLVILSILLLIQKSGVEQLLLLGMTSYLAYFKLMDSLGTEPIYYLVTGCLILLCLLQLLVILVKRKEIRREIQSKNVRS